MIKINRKMHEYIDQRAIGSTNQSMNSITTVIPCFEDLETWRTVATLRTLSPGTVPWQVDLTGNAIKAAR